MTGGATSRFRMVGYCLLLTAIAFVQAPGRIVADTKFDLSVDPVGFMAKALHLWDPTAAFGQVQNQAYGYFWPMGPFFALGDLVNLPAWVVQRCWWAVLLSVAFVGVVQLARALRLGTGWAQVLAGFAFALSAHVLTLVGPTSVEAWPSALAPWVLLPLVHAAERGSVRRGAARSALAVAMCGGVNAVAVSAVLPLGAIWLLTRTPGPRRRALLAWWPALTVLATLWWSVPLLLLGRYSAPFLDYIENASITTTPTSLPDVLGGTSDWVAYVAGQDWVAGHLLGTTPLLLLDAAVVAGLGLAGIARRDNPHARFLLFGVLGGIVLVTFGYTGPWHGWLAEDRMQLLDGVLAPFRNVHKYDVVLRLPLVLGLAHLVSVYQPSPRTFAERASRNGVVLAAVFSVIGVSSPVYTGDLAPQDSVRGVPGYWHAAAGYLAQHGSVGTALELPASAFGDYRWGSSHDDVMQVLARSPWAVRSVLPLAQPGNVRMLDGITRAVEVGRPDPRLADFLASNGIGHLVVRNDLNEFRSGVPNPVVLHQVLDRSPGLRKVAEFGPLVGEDPLDFLKSGEKVLTNRGRAAAFRSVEIYRVRDGAPPVSGWEAGSVPVVAGDPFSRTGTDARGAPAVLAGDAGRGALRGPTILTDGLKRREMAFTEVRGNESATMSSDQPWRLRSVEPNHRLYRDQARWETTSGWIGVAGVRASSSRGFADAIAPLAPGNAPAAAMDGRGQTQFVTSGYAGAVGQWWRVDLEEATDVRAVTVTMGTPVGPRVTRLDILTSAGTLEDVNARRSGRPRTYRLPRGRTDFVTVRASEVADGGAGTQFALGEVALRGISATHVLRTPRASGGRAPDQIALTREQNRPACVWAGPTRTCDDFWRTTGEDADSLNRTVSLPELGIYQPELTATIRPRRRAVAAVAAALPVRVTASSVLSTDPAASALAAVDSDPHTTWVARRRIGQVPWLRLEWDGPVRLQRIRLALDRRAPGARPLRVRLRTGTARRSVALDRDGSGSFAPLLTDHLEIRFTRVRAAYTLEGDEGVRLPVGVSEVSFPGSDLMDRMPSHQRVDLGCRSGPRLTVGGRTVRTRLEASLAQVLAGEELPVSLCSPASSLALTAGENLVLAGPSAVSRPERLLLRRDGLDVPAAVPVPVTATRWSPGHRVLAVGDRDTDTLLVVNENANPGWVATSGGRRLPAQRVDGWKQGWVLPAGAAGTVALTYVPDAGYRWSLGLGAVALVLVALLCLGSRQRRAGAPALASATGRLWLDGAFLTLAGGMVAGWPGFVAVGVALALRASDPSLAGRAGWSAGLLLGGAGVVHALARSEGFHPHAPWAQLIGVLALGCAVLGAKGPAFFRRRIGRSTR